MYSRVISHNVFEIWGFWHIKELKSSPKSPICSCTCGDVRCTCGDVRIDVATCAPKIAILTSKRNESFPFLFINTQSRETYAPIPRITWWSTGIGSRKMHFEAKMMTFNDPELCLVMLDFYSDNISHPGKPSTTMFDEETFQERSEFMFLERTSQTISHVAHVATSVFRNGARANFLKPIWIFFCSSPKSLDVFPYVIKRWKGLASSQALFEALELTQ